MICFQTAIPCSFAIARCGEVLHNTVGKQSIFAFFNLTDAVKLGGLNKPKAFGEMRSAQFECTLRLYMGMSRSSSQQKNLSQQLLAPKCTVPESDVED